MSTTQQSVRPEDLLFLVDDVLARIAPGLPPHVSREDLAGVAREALMRAVGDYVGDGTDLTQFMTRRIRRAVLDEQRRLDPLSRRTRRRVRMLSQTGAMLTQALGREPSDEELADAAEMSIALVRQTLDLAEAAGYVDDFDAAQAVVDDDVATPVEAIEQVETVALVRAALGRLPARQVDVLWRYHVEGETVTEIGAALGISAARVSQLRIQAEIHMLSNVSLVNL